MDPNERIADLETHLIELSGLVASLPNAEQAERAIRVERQVNRIMAFAVFPTILVLGLIVFALFGVAEIQEAAEDNRSGIRCVLEQLAEHRQVNHALNEAIARQVGVDVPIGRTLSPPTIPEELVEACEPFYPEDGPTLRGP